MRFSISNASAKATTASQFEDSVQLLRPHLGRALFLARYFAEEIRSRAYNDATRAVATALDYLLTMDREAPDGLTDIARASPHLAIAHLSEMNASGLEAGPLTDDRLRLLLAGGPGTHAFATALVQQVIGSIGA